MEISVSEALAELIRNHLEQSKKEQNEWSGRLSKLITAVTSRDENALQEAYDEILDAGQSGETLAAEEQAGELDGDGSGEAA